jgi:DnaJ-class molecular chaperone
VKHYYKTLNVNLRDDSESIYRAYIASIRNHPPEKAPYMFEKITEAYEAIKTEEGRLALEIGVEKGLNYPFRSPKEATIRFLKSDISSQPPSEAEFYRFLKS